METDSVSSEKIEKDGELNARVEEEAEEGRQEHDAMEAVDTASMPVDIAHVLGCSGERGEEEGLSCTCPEHVHGPIKNPAECPRCLHRY